MFIAHSLVTHAYMARKNTCAKHPNENALLRFGSDAAGTTVPVALTAKVAADIF